MSYGNPPMDGISKNLTSKPGSQPNRPGKITRGPGKQKVKMHLIASHGKMPAEIYAHAVARRQGATTGPAKLPNPVANHTNPEVQKAQAATAVDTVHQNRDYKPRRKELTKTYSRPVGPIIDKRSSRQRMSDAQARQSGGR